MADIFISYSKLDRAVAEALAGALRARGHDVWWDFELYAGEDFHDVILSELDRAKAVVVIWSDTAVASRWVRGEADHAAKQGKLVPTSVPGFDAGRIPLNFRSFHTEAVDNRERIFRSLARLGVQPPRPRQAAPPLVQAQMRPPPVSVQPPYVGRAQQLAEPIFVTAGPAMRGPGAAVREWLRFPKRNMAAAVIALAVFAALWGAYTHGPRFVEFMSPARDVAPESLEVSPLQGFRATAEATDAVLQRSAVWRILKREFADWYAWRLKDAAALSAQGKDDTAVAQHMARALVVLRRENSKHALAASYPKLKAIASTFYDNLVQLRKHSAEACFEFIAKGEASPTVISLMQSPQQTAHLQAQMAAVFEAIADGRKAPRVYPQALKTDYDALAADLAKLGWSQADLKLFSDERALASAGPEKVCQLVHDWFAAQLAVKDPDMQRRLLVDSLKPVVAG